MLYERVPSFRTVMLLGVAGAAVLREDLVDKASSDPSRLLIRQQQGCCWRASQQPHRQLRCCPHLFFVRFLTPLRKAARTPNFSDQNRSQSGPSVLRCLP
jgi:hypothetical protein